MKKLLLLLNNHITLVSITLFALVIRVALFPLPPFKIDNDAWIAWSLNLASGGLSNFYQPGYFSDYLPGYLYVLALLGHIQKIFSLSIETYALILKIPPIIADFFVGFLLYFIVLNKTKNINWASVTTTLFLLNPMVIFNSTIWGQADSVLALGIILTTLFLSQQKYILASILAAASFLIKPQSLVLGSIFLSTLISKPTPKQIALLTFPATATLLLLSFPFFSNPLTGLTEKFLSTASQYSYTSLFAYNLWGIVGFWLPDNTQFFYLTYQQWGIFLFTLFFFTVFVLILKKRTNPWILITLTCLAFFFLPTKVHERYLYPSVPLLLIVASFIKSKKLLFLTTLLSILSALNLYYVYVYYNETYLNLEKLLYFEPLYSLLDSNGKLLSFLSTTIFIIIVWIVIKKGIYGQKNHQT